MQARAGRVCAWPPTVLSGYRRPESELGRHPPIEAPVTHIDLEPTGCDDDVIIVTYVTS